MSTAALLLVHEPSAVGPAERLALRAAQRAAAGVPGYRDHLAAHGVRIGAVRRLDQLPVLESSALRAADPADWAPGGDPTRVAEIVASSGQSGTLALGLVGATEREELGDLVDAELARMGASSSSPTLLVNCLPGGVVLPGRLATVASPGTRPDVAVALLSGVGRRFDRVVLVGDPVLLKEVAELGRATAGPGWAPGRLHVVVGGEWVAESWRDRFVALAGGDHDEARVEVTISMGTAELGLHLFAETPALRAARRLLGTSEARLRVFGHDPGYAPALLTYDPFRVLVEERDVAGGGREMVVTTLMPRDVPLVRLASGDLAEHVPSDALDALLAESGAGPRTQGPVIAMWGRTGALRGDGWSIRPEMVKEAVFADPEAGRLTGRFFLETGGGAPIVHLQFRGPATAPPGMTEGIAAAVGAVAGREPRVLGHACGAYPWHHGADYQHKPRYLDAGPIGGSR